MQINSSHLAHFDTVAMVICKTDSVNKFIDPNYPKLVVILFHLARKYQIFTFYHNASNMQIRRPS